MDTAENIPYMATKRQVSTAGFVARHPVFSLDEAAEAMSPPGGKPGTVERLKHHLETGRLKLVARELYAVVPEGTLPEHFRPDPFLVARAARLDAIFSHHSALELLGAAHSVWSQCTVFSESRRPPLSLNGQKVRFFDDPKPLRDSNERELGTRRVERLGTLLRTTGPERTLVEGFKQLDLAGGASELVESAGGFATLDLELLEQILKRYKTRRLWAATGWFLEAHRTRFHVSDERLDRWRRYLPRSPQYLMRDQRGGTLASRWNLIFPSHLMKGDSDAG